MKKTPVYTQSACYSGRKRLAALLLLISAIPFSSVHAAAITGGAHTLTHGWNYLGKADVTARMTMTGLNGQTGCVNAGYWFVDYSGWSINGGTLSRSSDGIATGWKSPEGDVLLVFRGGQVDGQNLNSSCIPTAIPSATWNSAGQYSVSPKMPEWVNQWKGGITADDNSFYLRWQKSGATLTTRVNTDIYIYVGPNAVTGKQYHIPAVKLYMEEHGTSSSSTDISGTMNITVKAAPRVCTVSTDTFIAFPPADVTDAVSAKPLANKTGNFTITCDDTSNNPVTVEIRGTKGRYTDTLALQMSDGSNAPAEVRGFIGSDIPLGGECNGRLNGYNGVVYFVSNAGLEKISLEPGSHKYNWVLCSTGEYKTGKAIGSATMVVNWD